MDCGPPGSSFHGVLQARLLEWVVISFSRSFSFSSLPRDQTQVSYIAGGFFLPSEPPGKPKIRVYDHPIYIKVQSQPKLSNLLNTDT